MELWNLHNLIKTPDFAGLPNLESFKLWQATDLEEIHSSFGLLEKLVFLSIKLCGSIKIFPCINRLTNLKTLSFYRSPGLFQLSEIQQKMDRSPHSHFDNSGDTQVKNRLKNLKTILFHKTRLRFYRADLKKLDLSSCNLKDEDICSSEWELPHLQELDLSFNDFLELDFSPWRLPLLKRLDVRGCYSLVELSNLPSSIAVVDAKYCMSLKWFGDTSNCKWLWNISISKGYKLDPFHGERLLYSMLQGNAIEDHFISVTLEHQIPKLFVGRFFGGPTFTLRHLYYVSNTVTLNLPDDWYNDFRGFLMRVVTQPVDMYMEIIMKQEADEEDSRCKIWQEFDESPEHKYNGEMRTYVGYVSFNSLRHTTSLNSSYNIISFSIENRWSSFAAELVPLKSKDDAVQTTKTATTCSEFRDEEDGYFTKFKDFQIQEDSKSSIKIHWDVY